MNCAPLGRRALPASRLPGVVLIFALLGAVPQALAAQLYACGMHPQIIRKEPGNCPVCGMALTPVRSDGAGPTSPAAGRKIKYYKSSMNPGEVSDKPGRDSMGMDLVPVYEDGNAGGRAIQIAAAMVQKMNLKTATVVRGPVVREFRTVGAVAFAENGLRDITLKYEAWIEKLHVGATWSTVRAGEPLFEVYSPDLYNAELNYVVALQSEGEGGGPLTDAAMGRLRLLDLPSSFINEIARTRQARRTFTYKAPVDGTVVEKMAVEGQMMKPGERIYRLADLGTVWVEAQVFEQDLPFVHPGQDAAIRVTYGPERLLAAKVEALLPRVDEQTRAATARIVLPNPNGALRPGMFVDVRFASRLADNAVLVPDLAVLRSGEHNTVFIARGDGSFEPREIRLGARSQGDFYEVLAGLDGGERVVTSGQFMLDSESQLRDAIQKMLAPGNTGDQEPPASVTATGAASPAAADATAEPSPTDPDRRLLRDLALNAIDAAESLAADDLPGYQKALPKMRAGLEAFLAGSAHAAHGPLGELTAKLPDRADLKSARRDFARFSTAVADLVRATRLNGEAGWHVFQCPMAPGIGTGRWLSRTATLRNPFLGTAMSDCGEEVSDAADAPR